MREAFLLREIDYFEHHAAGGEEAIWAAFHAHQREENLASDPNYYEDSGEEEEVPF